MVANCYIGASDFSTIVTSMFLISSLGWAAEAVSIQLNAQLLVGLLKD